MHFQYGLKLMIALLLAAFALSLASCDNSEDLNAMLGELKNMKNENDSLKNELKEEQKRYRALFATIEHRINDGFVISGTDGKIITANDKFAGMLNYKRSSLEGKNYYDLLPISYHRTNDNMRQEQVIVYGFSEFYEQELLKRRDKNFPVKMREFLMRSPDGKPAKFLGIVEDLSGKKFSYTFN